MTMPTLEINEWYMIDQFMRDEYLEPLKTAVRDACGKDQGLMQKAWDKRPDAVNGYLPPHDPMTYGVQRPVTVDLPDLQTADGATLSASSPDDFWSNVQTVSGSYGTQANDRMDAVESVWTDEYQPYSNTPKKLFDVSESWAKIGEALPETSQTIARLGQIQGWTGEGAKAYGRVVPAQMRASDETGTLVAASGNVLANASQGLQSLYLSVAATFADAKTTIETLSIPEPQSDIEAWNYLCNAGPWARSVASVLEQVRDYLSNELKGHQTYWAASVRDASDILDENAEVNDEVFIKGNWPKSEADKLGTMEQGGDGSPITPDLPMETPSTTTTPDTAPVGPAQPKDTPNLEPGPTGDQCVALPE